MRPNLHQVKHEPDTPLPRQTRINITRHLPPIIGGLFIILTRGEFFIAYIGPFIGAWAIWDLMGLWMKMAKSTGATHYEIFDPRQNGKDANIQ